MTAADDLSSLPPPGQRLAGAERSRTAAMLRKRYERGWTIMELADATGYSTGLVPRLLREAGTELRSRGRGPAWTPEDVQRLKDLMARGWAAYRIGQEIGRSEGAVQHKSSEIRRSAR